MEFLEKINKFIINLIILILFFGMYDVYLLSNWLEKRLLDRFIVAFTLKDDTNKEKIIESIKSMCNLLKIKKITYLDKNQIYEEVKGNPEIKTLLSVIMDNPFSDTIKIEFSNYFDEEVEKILKLDMIFPNVKEIIYDYNLKSYLKRFKKIKLLFEKIAILSGLFLGIFVVFNLASKGSYKISFSFVLFWSFIYFVMFFLNMRFFNNFISYDLIKLDDINIIFHVCLYVFFLNLSIEKEEKTFLQEMN
ncbi:MAG: hypothetical protein ABDH23_00295 [Endomicrobiia bacterium]